MNINQLFVKEFQNESKSLLDKLLIKWGLRSVEIEVKSEVVRKGYYKKVNKEKETSEITVSKFSLEAFIEKKIFDGDRIILTNEYLRNYNLSVNEIHGTVTAVENKGFFSRVFIKLDAPLLETIIEEVWVPDEIKKSNIFHCLGIVHTNYSNELLQDVDFSLNVQSPQELSKSIQKRAEGFKNTYINRMKNYWPDNEKDRKMMLMHLEFLYRLYMNMSIKIKSIANNNKIQ